jgi:hypothetical protein
MSKKNRANGNGTEKLTFLYQDINSFGFCEINGPECNKIIVKEIRINNHYCADRKKICASPSCSKIAKGELAANYDTNKKEAKAINNQITVNK